MPGQQAVAERQVRHGFGCSLILDGVRALNDDKPTGEKPTSSNSPNDPPPIEPLDVEEFELLPDERVTQKLKQSPLGWSEILGVGLLIGLCDITIYRGQGFAGYALLFAVASVLLWIASRQRCRHTSFWVVAAMLLALAGKMVWCGSHLLTATGFTLVVAFAMTLVGFRPYVLDTLFYALQSFQSGCYGLVHYAKHITKLRSMKSKAGWINFILPALAFYIFSFIFVLANPDLKDLFGEEIARIFNWLIRWIRQYSVDFREVLFWFAVLWIAVGLLRPVMAHSQDPTAEKRPDNDSAEKAKALLYPAYRNTLITVSLLFAVYLVFEFKQMWFHTFPKGFHYSGYAHEGAAWLTAALALATAMLSMVFRGSILNDPRLNTLRKLAWVWSIENMLLAAAVYNRLFIYIGFNGMSRMRIVGLYGMSAVVVGFLLVVWKIVHNRNLLWLTRRHLWTLAIAVYLLAMTPLDTIVVSYNVKRILAGDPAPAVQISVHPINAEGILLLQPLLDSDNETIREGVRALLAEYHDEAELNARRQKKSWTAYQWADRIALDELRKNEKRWEQYTHPGSRKPVLKRFHNYAYQWF